MKISEIVEGLDLYKLSNNPEKLHGHDKVKDMPWNQDPERYIDTQKLKALSNRIEVRLIPLYVLYDDQNDDHITSTEYSDFLEDALHELYNSQQDLPGWTGGDTTWSRLARTSIKKILNTKIKKATDTQHTIRRR